MEGSFVGEREEQPRRIFQTFTFKKFTVFNVKWVPFKGKMIKRLEAGR